MKATHEADVEERLSTPAPLGGDYWLEPGAPAFKVGPGGDQATAETLKLGMMFGQIQGDEVVPQIEWSGANAEPASPLMMEQPQRPGAKYQKYQLKTALARPSLPEDEVTFDIRFRWQGATRQYRWRWKLHILEPKGIWRLTPTRENTHEPAERTTLD